MAAPNVSRKKGVAVAAKAPAITTPQRNGFSSSATMVAVSSVRMAVLVMGIPSALALYGQAGNNEGPPRFPSMQRPRHSRVRGTQSRGYSHAVRMPVALGSPAPHHHHSLANHGSRLSRPALNPGALSRKRHHATGDGRIFVPIPACADAVMAIGDSEGDAGPGVAPDQQHGRFFLTLFDLFQLIGDMGIVLLQKMGLAGPEQILGLAMDQGRAGQRLRQLSRLGGREKQGEIIQGSGIVLLQGLGQPDVVDLPVFLLHRNSGNEAECMGVPRRLSAAFPGPARPDDGLTHTMAAVAAL